MERGRGAGPLQGHWTSMLKLSEIIDDGKVCIWHTCTRDSENSERSTIRCYVTFSVYILNEICSCGSLFCTKSFHLELNGN